MEPSYPKKSAFPGWKPSREGWGGDNGMLLKNPKSFQPHPSAPSRGNRGVYRARTYLRKPWRCGGEVRSGIPAGKAPGSGREFRAALPMDAGFNPALPGERREPRSPFVREAQPGKDGKTGKKKFRFHPKKGLERVAPPGTGILG